MSIRIAASLLDDILASAAASPEAEVCGLLFGEEDHIASAQSARNVADNPRRAFEIDPAALFAALRAERNGGPRLIGHYHSHPNGHAEPSPRDLAAAEPGRLWLICAAGRARAWLAEEGRFRERPLRPI